MASQNKPLETRVVAAHKDDVILWVTTDMISERPMFIQIGIHRNGHNYEVISKQSLNGEISSSNKGLIREKTKPGDLFDGLNTHINSLANLNEYAELNRFSDDTGTNYIAFQRNS